MVRILLALLALAVVFADGGSGLAAKKKKTEPPTKPKAIYEAPMTVVIARSSDPSCEPLCPEWIAAIGEITMATPSRFRQVFKQMGKKKLPIIITSPGGAIDAATEIGRMIRKRKLDVGVGITFFDDCKKDYRFCSLPTKQKGPFRGIVSPFYAFCNSACPLILAAGGERLASVETSVGVHKPKRTSWQERVYYRETYRMVNGKKKVVKRTVTGRKRVNNQVSYEFGKSLRKKLSGYYKEMGIDPAIMDDSEKAAYQEMETLRGERLDALKLRTSSKSVAILTDWITCRREPVPGNCVKEDAKKLSDKKGKRDEAMTFVLVRNSSPSCEPVCPSWLWARGRIESGSVKNLEMALAAMKQKPKAIVLDSTGGDLLEARALGHAIRKAELDTFPGFAALDACDRAANSCNLKILPPAPAKTRQQVRCQAECVFAFAGGVDRILENDSLVSLPGLGRTGSAPNSYDWNDVNVSYFKHMGTTVLLLGVMMDWPMTVTTDMDSGVVRGGNLATQVVPSLAEFFTVSSCKDKSSSRYCSRQ